MDFDFDALSYCLGGAERPQERGQTPPHLPPLSTVFLFLFLHRHSPRIQNQQGNPSKISTAGGIPICL